MKRVLIVDDVKDMRELLEAVAESAGFATEAAASAKEALTLVSREETEPFDIILLDINLPDGSGIGVLQRIRKMEEIEEQPQVCFISGEKDKAVVLRAIAAGGADYIVKPIEPAVLVGKLRKLAGLPEDGKVASIKCQLKADFPNLPIESNTIVTELHEGGFYTFHRPPHQGRRVY